MRDELIGYLLDALEPEERAEVAAQLSRDLQLQRELELLSQCLLPLAADKPHYEPPAGLAHRTVEFVAIQTRVMTAPPAPSPRSNRWTWADAIVAAGLFLAATALFFPAVNQSRFAGRVLACQNNLRELGVALTNYSDLNEGYFPNIPPDGRLSAAGIYAPRLVEGKYLTNHNLIVCPASQLAETVHEFRVPTCKDLQAAPETTLVRLHRQMGGSYGYNIGYVAGGKYQGTRNLHRTNFAIMADEPGTVAPYGSPNHGGHGQNVLFEDGHVQYLTSCKARGCNDDIFRNDMGQVAAGMHLHDAVVGPSHARPIVIPVLIRPMRTQSTSETDKSAK